MGGGGDTSSVAPSARHLSLKGKAMRFFGAFAPQNDTAGGFLRLAGEGETPHPSRLRRAAFPRGGKAFLGVHTPPGKNTPRRGRRGMTYLCFLNFGSM